MRTLNRALLRAEDEPWLLNEICRVVVEIGEYPGAWIAYRDPDRSPSLQPAAQAGTLDAKSFPAAVLESPDPILSRAEPHTLSLSGARPVLLLPLVSDGRDVLGLLAIQAATEAGFDEAETDLLSETAQDLAFGLRTLRLQQRERQARATIERMEWYEPDGPAQPFSLVPRARPAAGTPRRISTVAGTVVARSPPSVRVVVARAV